MLVQSSFLSVFATFNVPSYRWTSPRAARERSVRGNSGDFMEAVFQIGKFSDFYGEIPVLSDGKRPEVFGIFPRASNP
jgi:hypothetical protein